MSKPFVNCQRFSLIAAVVGFASVPVIAPVQAQQANGLGNLNGLVPAKNIKMPMPSDPSVALHGKITTDTVTVRDKTPVRFTYKITNTSNSVRYASVPAGGLFTVAVKARRPGKSDTAIWTMGNSAQKQVEQGRVAFAPGETKNFTAEWVPSAGTVKAYKSFVAEARLIGTVTKQRASNVPTAKHGPPASATLVLKGA